LYIKTLSHKQDQFIFCICSFPFDWDKLSRDGLDGPVIESTWGARFSSPVHTGPGVHPASYKMSTGSLSRG